MAVARFSSVTEFLAAEPSAAEGPFAARLAFETDPADVHADLMKGDPRFVLVDARSREAFARSHLPGAVSLPWRHIGAESTRDLPRDRLLVTYCWGPSCNASTKAALKLARLGFRVKEMIGGIEYWEREGHPLERGDDQR